MAYDISSSRSNQHSNGKSNATYSTMVRQLESSPSQTRRAHTLQRKQYGSGQPNNGNVSNNPNNHYSLHLNSIPRKVNPTTNFDSSTPSPANSTFDSALPERVSSRSDYSGSLYQTHYHYHPQQQSSPKRLTSPPEKPFSPASYSRRSSSGTSSQNHHQHHPST